MPTLGFLAFLLGAVASFGDPGLQETPRGRWWKGNTHTHTLWSDGDVAPEAVVAWYREHGYDFLVLSDHNVLSEGERWFPVSEEVNARLRPAQVDSLRGLFGDSWVEQRSRGGGREMRLKTLTELKIRFEEEGAFMLIVGEEITDRFLDAPVHVNGLNIAELVPPQGGDTLRATLQRNIDEVVAQGQRLGRPVLAHVNHPNFGWALTAEDLAAIRGECFFEVYNGHSGVRNQGDRDHPGTEALWDTALTLRLAGPDPELLYGLAADDAHDYHRWGAGRNNPGRGWVMVQAERLDPASIFEALRRGRFYATSGVLLRSLESDGQGLHLEVDLREEETCVVSFIGTRRTRDGLGPAGEVLAQSAGPSARYEFQGDELYVRAQVVSSRLHPNPYAPGDHETAWVQPVRPPAR